MIQLFVSLHLLGELYEAPEPRADTSIGISSKTNAVVNISFLFARLFVDAFLYTRWNQKAMIIHHDYITDWLRRRTERREANAIIEKWLATYSIETAFVGRTKRMFRELTKVNIVKYDE